MLSARKQVKIISLGEIVTLDIMKTIQAFTALIAEKLKQVNQPVNSHEIGKSIGLVLQSSTKIIDDFKLGALNENDFTEKMINVFEKETTITLTTQEFDHAWNAMNPKFQQFEAFLKQAVEYNSQPNQKVVFISFTNPKDIRSLVNELKNNEQSYQVDDDQLVEICGIPLHTTYANQQTKAELIETTIKRLNTKVSTQSSLANSMSNVVSIEQAKEFEPLDIKYIRGVNNINDPILKEDLDKTNQTVEKKAAAFFVDTIIWMKQERSLSAVLSDQQVVSNQISATRL